VDGDAYRYLVSLSKQRRRLLERAIESLAAHPLQRSLFSDQSAEGLKLDVIELESHLITYHADHAIRRIRVTEILPNS
jgi:plasmid stabilization system protein ParE